MLGCLCDHPHDNTPELLSARIAVFDTEAVAAALEALEQDSYVLSAGDHWSLTRRGWLAARACEQQVA
ncbi:hypothetical protein DVA67_032785 [Solirubrobacter sp. CPCC 204708]|uniref:Uncharacterized protein n=1 Tax=Solirubrobacter deserti TaxID=2282478 RepID=A0ABT4RIN0_9ACTN|nr:hypothetical protein [Solirubrobacter deserti]MBE2320782.1 hypothetical protein [Solirubrobacter deserti]MDA0138417.1 hypothetical protein [Solirubrobacter deserti]